MKYTLASYCVSFSHMCVHSQLAYGIDDPESDISYNVCVYVCVCVCVCV